MSSLSAAILSTSPKTRIRERLSSITLFVVPLSLRKRPRTISTRKPSINGTFPANEDRHSCCRFKKRANFDNWEERPQTLRLSALRCCRQMYNEAHYVPYSTNTFSCVDPVTLRMFIRSLTQGSHENHLAVRSLFLEMVFVRYYNSRWRKTLKICAKHLKNLKNVNISLEWNCRFWIYGAGSPAKFEANWQTPVMSDIFVLKQLPLESATLVISDDYLRWPQKTSLGGPARWTPEEKQEWARYTKDLILK